jgi:hypothetical protein
VKEPHDTGPSKQKLTLPPVLLVVPALTENEHEALEAGTERLTVGAPQSVVGGGGDWTSIWRVRHWLAPFESTTQASAVYDESLAVTPAARKGEVV